MAAHRQQTAQDKSSPGPASQLDQQTLGAIRGLLDTDPQAPPQQPATPDPPRRGRALHAFGAVKGTPKPAQTPAKNASILNRVRTSALGFRPTRRRLLLIGFGLLLFFRPVVVLSVLILFLLATTGLFLILGSDSFWNRVMGLARRYAAHRPARAARMHQQLDVFAMKWDAFLDRFPEGSVDGLYLPDLGDLTTSEVPHGVALDQRFANLARQRT